MESFAALFSDHARIASSAAALRRIADTAPDPAEACHAISMLSRLLRAHLVAEDRAVYRRLLACRDCGVAETARAARRSFATLARDWRDYVKEWTSETIKVDSGAFAIATAALLDRLEARIIFENETLYPLAVGLADLPLREPPGTMAA